MYSLINTFFFCGEEGKISVLVQSRDGQLDSAERYSLYQVVYTGGIHYSVQVGCVDTGAVPVVMQLWVR